MPRSSRPTAEYSLPLASRSLLNFFRAFFNPDRWRFSRGAHTSAGSVDDSNRLVVYSSSEGYGVESAGKQQTRLLERVPKGAALLHFLGLHFHYPSLSANANASSIAHERSHLSQRSAAHRLEPE